VVCIRDYIREVIGPVLAEILMNGSRSDLMRGPSESTRQQNSGEIRRTSEILRLLDGREGSFGRRRFHDCRRASQNHFVCANGPPCAAGPDKFYEMCPAVVGWQRGFWERDLNARSAVPRPIPSCTAISAPHARHHHNFERHAGFTSELLSGMVGTALAVSDSVSEIAVLRQSERDTY
jgi:hypothetical protein